MLKSQPVDHPHRSGRFIQQTTGYKAFIPTPLPPEPAIEYSGRLQTLSSKPSTRSSTATAASAAC